MSAFNHPLWRNAMTSIQAEVADMSADELRQRATDIRRASQQEHISSDDRMTFTLMVFAAILRSRHSPKQREQMQIAWLKGIGISHLELASVMFPK